MDGLDFKMLVRETMVIMREAAADSMDRIIQSSYDLGKITALVEAGELSPWISYNEATLPKKEGGLGRKLVDRWVREGLIEKIKDGPRNSGTRFDRIKLATLAAKSNRASWFAFNNTQ